MEENFALFFAYHFWRPFTDFQKKRMRSLQSRKNTMIVWFRASRKTTIVRGFIVWCVCYKKEPSIVWQSFEDTLSGESVREVAKMMCKPSIVDDYWMLFPFESKRESLAKKSLKNFETTNGVKIVSKSLRQTLRWANTYDQLEETSARPTLLVLDDIDVTDSVRNVEIISQNEKKIRAETIWALDPLRRKVIFLWNVINEDGVVPRFRENYNWTDTRDCFWQPLFDNSWQNARPEVFTPDVVQQLKDDGKTSWNQNYMLIPSTKGSGTFLRDYFDYFLLSDFENPESFLKKDDLDCWIFIDPAFSTNERSDDAVVIWWWIHQISRKFYIIDWYANTSATSRTISAVISMYNRMKMDWFNLKFMSVEDVKINTKQSQFVKDLKDALVEHEINIPLYLYTNKIKKEDRIKDTLEPVMSQKWIKTNRNISQPNFIFSMENQFLEYPNAEKDDITDTIEQMVSQLKLRCWKKVKKKKKYRRVRDPWTGEMKLVPLDTVNQHELQPSTR